VIAWTTGGHRSTLHLPHHVNSDVGETRRAVEGTLSPDRKRLHPHSEATLELDYEYEIWLRNKMERKADNGSFAPETALTAGLTTKPSIFSNCRSLS
jgi:hypothetical protein